MDCGHQQVRMPGRPWRPEGPAWCPECHPHLLPPAQQPKAPATYKGDILADLDAAGVNVRKYRGATLDTFDASEDPHALSAARAYVESWAGPGNDHWRARDWLYFYGAGSARNGRDVTIGRLGNGKTFLAVAIARALIEAAHVAPKSFVFRTAETILLESEATFRSNADDSERKLLARYGRPDLLIIDDFGVRDAPSPHAVRLFDELTKRREARATIWTSNLSLQVLADANENMRRIVDRIAGECGDESRYVVTFRGRSRRRERALRVMS